MISSKDDQENDRNRGDGRAMPTLTKEGKIGTDARELALNGSRLKLFRAPGGELFVHERGGKLARFGGGHCA